MRTCGALGLFKHIVSTIFRPILYISWSLLKFGIVIFLAFLLLSAIMTLVGRYFGEDTRQRSNSSKLQNLMYSERPPSILYDLQNEPNPNMYPNIVEIPDKISNDVTLDSSTSRDLERKSVSEKLSLSS